MNVIYTIIFKSFFYYFFIYILFNTRVFFIYVFKIISIKVCMKFAIMQLIKLYECLIKLFDHKR